LTRSPNTEPVLPAILEKRVLIVPYVPGPLIDPDASAQQRPRDEIDEVIDEVFGPDPGGSPGRMDALLLLGGCGLLLWSQLGLHSTGVTVVAAVLIFLGLVLPIRSLWRKATAQRLARRRHAFSSRGVALNAGHPLTRDLVSAYEQLLEAADQPGAPFKSDAVSAAHLALTESATLVGEAGPTTAAEVEYVERRVAAIRGLATEMQRHSQLVEEGRLDGQDEERLLQRTARALAGEELDATGLSSLRELDDLKRVLARDADD
jgi:hypothetical protein